MIDPSFLKKKKPKWRYPIIAVLFHIFVVGALVLLELHFRREMIKDELKKLQVKTISNKDLEKILSRARVVDTEWTPPEQKNAKDPRRVYEGEKTQRVDEETRSKDDGTSQGSVKPGMTKPLPSQKENPFGRKLQPGEKSKFKKGNYDVLDPSIKIANKTLLNTNAYIYAQFTNRMKESIAAIWDPRARKVLSNREKPLGIGIYITVVRIFVQRDGTVERVIVEQSSGIPELDQAGVSSILQVRAFPNPPPDLFKAPSKGDFDFSFVASVVPGSLLRFNYIHDEKLDR